MRAVGIRETVETDVYEMHPQPGDLFLMCSDGLTDMLSDEEIHRAVSEGGALEMICDRLVKMANVRGGLDNVTVLLFLMQKERAF